MHGRNLQAGKKMQFCCSYLPEVTPTTERTAILLRPAARLNRSHRRRRRRRRLHHHHEWTFVRSDVFVLLGCVAAAANHIRSGNYQRASWEAGRPPLISGGHPRRRTANECQVLASSSSLELCLPIVQLTHSITASSVPK